MRIKKLRLFVAGAAVLAYAAHAFMIGNFPGLGKMVEQADAIVILRTDEQVGKADYANGLVTFDCFICQSIKGNLTANTTVRLRLMDTRGTGFGSPFTPFSTHLMFLMKKPDADEPTEYRTMQIQGANVALTPIGWEKPMAGKTAEEKVRSVIQGAIEYNRQNYEKEQAFLKTMTGP